MVCINKNTNKKRIVILLAVVALFFVLISSLCNFIVLEENITQNESLAENKEQFTEFPKASIANIGYDDVEDTIPFEEYGTSPAETSPAETDASPEQSDLLNTQSHSISFRTPSSVELLSMFFRLLPIVAFIFFFLQSQGTDKYDVIIPIIFFYCTLDAFFAVVINAAIGYNFLSTILSLILAIEYGQLACGALFGLHKKIFSVLPLVVILAIELIFFLAALISPNSVTPINQISIVTSYIGNILFILALLIFSNNYRIKCFLSASTPKAKLEMLEYQLKCGIITEEEYQSKRAEIISNL